jgi:D-alanyl-D-alanine carboxypeptidase
MPASRAIACRHRSPLWSDLLGLVDPSRRWDTLKHGSAAVVGAAILTAASLFLAGCTDEPKTIVVDDFESGALTGWKALASGAGGWYVYSDGRKAPDPAASDPNVPFAVPDPPQGRFAAVTDMNGPGTRILYRDVKLDGHFVLHLTVFYAGSALTSPETLAHDDEPNQQFRIDLVDPSAPIDSVAKPDVLANVFRTSPGDPSSLEPTAVSVDLSRWSGETVRLRLAVTDNSGPLRAGVDDIRFEPMDTGASIRLPPTGAPSRARDVALLQPAPKAVEEHEAEIRRQPPFRLFAAWLDAFNSGDQERYAEFLAAKFPARLMFLGEEMGFRELTGGFDLRKLEQASATEVTGLVQERASDQFARFDLQLALDLDAAVSGEAVAARPYKIAQLSLVAIPRPAAFPIARLTQKDVIAGVEALLRRDAAADRFAGAVLVAKDGHVLFRRAYGLADRGRQIPNTPKTRFRIGSMNKMFTAVAILQLVEAGKIELDAPLGTYLDRYPNEDVASKVTIHHLLTHTGGTGDIFGPEFEAHRAELRALDDYVELYGKRGLEFEPGSRWAYSNYGFILLGAVIEKVTGQSYYDYVRQHVYEPAGMTATGSLPEGRAVPNRSVGYTKPPGGTAWMPNIDTLPYRGTSAGGGYSTVEDLARFARALTSHKLLNARSTELLITDKVKSGFGAGYAYGFEDRRDTHRNGSVGHGGGAPGMNGDLRIYPKSGYVIAVLANVDPPAAQRISDYLDARLPTRK